jgi:hypothetical protein
VVHRQVQQAERKLNWEPAPAPWALVSWISTMILINVAWIFFRSNSLAQSGQMLSAVFSPSTYGQHFLSSSLYLLVGVLSAGYAVVLLVSSKLSTDAEGDAGSPRLLARWQWFWIPPLYTLAMLFLLMITLTQSGGAGQLMYRSF